MAGWLAGLFNAREDQEGEGGRKGRDGGKILLREGCSIRGRESRVETKGVKEEVRE